MKVTAERAEHAFDMYNKKYFGNKLETPKFVFECDPGYFGYYRPHAAFDKYTRKITRVFSPGTLYLNGKYGNRSEKLWAETLLHEMIHMYLNTVRKIYPRDDHGRKFMEIAEWLNMKDGWNISEYGEMVDSEGNGQEERTEETRPVVICAVEKPAGKNYRLWLFRADEEHLEQYKQTARKLSAAGAKSMVIYKCNIPALMKLPANPETLPGIGGNDYNDVLEKAGRMVGVEIDQNLFSGYDEIKL